MSTMTRPRWIATGVAALAVAVAVTVIGVGTAGARTDPKATALPKAAGPAAGTVQILNGVDLFYFAGTGVTNGIKVGGTLDPILTLHDDAADIRLHPSATSRCQQVDPRSIRCTQISTATLRLGDGNDTLWSNGFTALTVYGGDGNDYVDVRLNNTAATLHGELGRDVLIGGPRNDRLSGGDEADVLVGWNGNDNLAADTSPGQITIGGDGTDVCTGTGIVSFDGCEH
jgi:Ca2+-binding RTX toxin-like protein